MNLQTRRKAHDELSNVNHLAKRRQGQRSAYGICRHLFPALDLNIGSHRSKETVVPNGATTKKSENRPSRSVDRSLASSLKLRSLIVVSILTRVLAAGDPSARRTRPETMAHPSGGNSPVGAGQRVLGDVALSAEHPASQASAKMQSEARDLDNIHHLLANA